MRAGERPCPPFTSTVGLGMLRKTKGRLAPPLRSITCKRVSAAWCCRQSRRCSHQWNHRCCRRHSNRPCCRRRDPARTGRSASRLCRSACRSGRFVIRLDLIASHLARPDSAESHVSPFGGDPSETAELRWCSGSRRPQQIFSIIWRLEASPALLRRCRLMTVTGPRSDLNDLMAPWERKFPHPMHDPIVRGLFGVDMNIAGTPLGKQSLRDTGPLAQDVFRSRVVRQGGI